MQFRLKDPEPLLFHNEPVLRNGEMIGYLTSGNYGHELGAAIGLGYVPVNDGESADDLVGSRFEINVAGDLIEATAALEPMFDPKAERMRD